jgi:hypothetical protein
VGAASAVVLLGAPLTFAATASAANVGHVSVAPTSVTATGNGGVGFNVHGVGLQPNEVYNISSSDLQFGCVTTNLPLNVTTDFSGGINQAVTATGCPSATYHIVVRQVPSPHNTFTVPVNVFASSTVKPKVKLSPAAEYETLTTGTVNTVLLVSDLDPNAMFAADAPALVGACPGGVTFTDINTGGAGAPPIGITTDFTGSDLVVISASGCAAGTYPVTLTELGGSRQNFTVFFTVKHA